MLKDLVKVASRLDSLGLSYEARFIDAVVRKFAHKEETYGGVDTSEEEAFENRRRSPYGGRDGGHKRGPRENRSKFRYNPEELSGENFFGEFSEDLSDDADDMFDSDGNLIDPIDFEREVGDEDFDQYDNPEETYFRRSESVAPRRGRSVYVPSDDANDMQRLAKRLSSLGLTKEARILSSIVKSAGDDDLGEDEDPSDWTDAQWSEHESGIPTTSFYDIPTATLEKEYNKAKDYLKESLAKTVEILPLVVGPMRQLIQSLKHDFEQTNKPELSEKISELEKLQSSLEAAYDPMYIVLNDIHDMDGDF
jgi:hypothetical protein